MELIWILLAALCIVIGIIGAFLPILPGLPFSYIGLLILHVSGITHYSTSFLVIWAIIIAAVLLVENALPIYTTSKFGGSAYGSRGSTIGMIIGLFLFPPFGFIVGTLIGAFLGEFFYKQDVQQAFKAAWGSFLGFITGTMIKIFIAIMFAVMFVKAIF